MLSTIESTSSGGMIWRISPLDVAEHGAMHPRCGCRPAGARAGRSGPHPPWEEVRAQERHQHERRDTTTRKPMTNMPAMAPAPWPGCCDSPRGNPRSSLRSRAGSGPGPRTTAPGHEGGASHAVMRLQTDTCAMVGTRVRDRMKEAIMANTTDIAIGTNR